MLNSVILFTNKETVGWWWLGGEMRLAMVLHIDKFSDSRPELPSPTPGLIIKMYLDTGHWTPAIPLLYTDTYHTSHRPSRAPDTL